MFKVKINIEAISIQKVAIANYTTGWITNHNIIISFFNKEFFDLVASGQIIFDHNDTNKFKSYRLSSKAIKIFIAHFEKQISKYSLNKDYKDLVATMMQIRKFLLINKEKCEEFMISFTPTTIEDLAYEYSDKLNLKG